MVSYGMVQTCSVLMGFNASSQGAQITMFLMFTTSYFLNILILLWFIKVFYVKLSYFKSCAFSEYQQ